MCHNHIYRRYIFAPDTRPAAVSGENKVTVENFQAGERPPKAGCMENAGETVASPALCCV